MYYAVNKNKEKLQGYTDPAYRNGYPSIKSAIVHCGEGGHVEDEDGNIVWTWNDWAK